MPETSQRPIGARVRIKDLDQQLIALARSSDGILSATAIAGMAILLGVVLAAYATGATWLAALFLAIMVIAAPFAVQGILRVGRPILRLATERSRLADRAEHVRARHGLPSRYLLPAAPPETPAEATPRRFDPFTAG